ncbi:WD-40 repeat protein [Minicystis rosea]|nr:WD-40 repeat protein [Minicystis rosea]
MRARSPFVSHLVAALALAACASPSPPPPAAPSQPAAAAPAPPPDPCTVAAAQRARVKGLVDEGRLDRALRVIAHADALCARTAPESHALRLTALVDLGRIDEARAAAAAIDRDPAASPEAREAAARARDAKPSTETLDAILDAAFAAQAHGKAAEAQRLFDRAAYRIEHDGGARLTLEIRNGLEAGSGLPWKSNGGIFPRSLGVIVPDVAVSHDEKREAIADGKLLLVTDLRKGRLRLRLEGHEANITSIAWSSNDRLLATSSYDGTARIWDATTGKALLVVKPADVVRSVRFLKQDTVLACVHEDASAWDVATGRLLGRAAGTATSASEIDPDGIVTMTENNVPRERFDLFTAARLDAPVPRATAFTSDDTVSVAAFADHLEIRRHPGGKRVRSITNKGSVQRVWITRDGKRIAAGEEDEDYGPIRRIKAFDVASGRLLGTLPIAGDAGYGVVVADVTADGKIVLPREGALHVFDLRSGQLVRKQPKESASRPIDGLGGDDALTPDSIAFAEGGSAVAVMLHREEGDDWPSRLALLDLQKRTLRDLEDARPSNTMRFLPSGKLMSFHYNDVTTWDLASGKADTILHADTLHAGVLHVTDDAQRAVLKGARDAISVIDLATHQRTREEQVAAYLGATADGHGIYFAQHDRRLALLDTRTGKTRILAEPAEGTWSQVAETRDGTRALLVDQVSPTRAVLYTLPLAGGPPRKLDRALESIDVLGTVGDRGLLVHIHAPAPNGVDATQILDADKGTSTLTIRSELWEAGNIVPTAGGHVFAASSRPEALFGFWSLDDGKPLAALRVLNRRRTAYVITADGHLEIFGDPADVLDKHAYCLAGTRVHPVEVCQERAQAVGILRGLLTNDFSWRNP